MNKILVTGGCGYIGSHTITDLLANDFEVVSVDNLCNSTPEVLDGIQEITGKKIQNYVVDLTDFEATRQIFIEHPDIVGIIHFAALKFVGESVEQPIRYFKNNLNSLLNVLACMEEFDVLNLIFSSSCSVYGNTTDLPVTEATTLQPPECPYARTKQMGEDIIQDYLVNMPQHKSILLRYFNPAGAHESNLIGESPALPPSNLVPVITETAMGKRDKITVFGDDYATRDGSCIRDYIHVMDLANAHTKALQYLLAHKNDKNCEVFNLGIGQGVSVLEAITAFLDSTEQDLNYEIGPRRAGDVEAIYANYEKAAKLLQWQPSRDINDIMRTAWAWEVKRSGQS